MTYSQIIEQLHQLANPEIVAYKEKKFGVKTNNALGIFMKDLNALTKQISKNNQLALELFDSGIYEAQILCSKIYQPKDVNEQLAEKWLKSFNNWEICDSFCMGQIAKSSIAKSKIVEWSARQPEFEKRAAFATLSAYCMADKKSGNVLFESFFTLITQQATDDRLYVKKAVNWALRSIGKRNVDLRKQAIEVAQELLNLESKSAQWIAKDAIKELENPKVRSSDYPREVYRAKV